MEPLHVSKIKKVCRPRLNRNELYEVYRLVSDEYWEYRHRGYSKVPQFFLLRRLRKKLKKILETMGMENLDQ